MNWLKLVKILAPLALSVVAPGAGPIIGGLIAHGISEAEQLKDSSSQQKLEHATNIVQDGISALNSVKPGTINPITVDDIKIAINKTVDAVNQLHAK